MSLNNEISETSIAACCPEQAFWLLNGAQLMLRSSSSSYAIVDIMQHLAKNRVIGTIKSIGPF
jgi:hypothetical protein